MAEATESTVLGDFSGVTFTAHGIESRFFRRDGKFFVSTEGPDGKIADFEVAYTFGVRPLQQYLVRFPGGRLQTLHLAWDVNGRRWFHLYPNDEVPARRLDALDPQRHELERHVRRVPLHQSRQGLRSRDTHVPRRPGRRSTSAARPATAPPHATSPGQPSPPWPGPPIENGGLAVRTRSLDDPSDDRALRSLPLTPLRDRRLPPRRGDPARRLRSIGAHRRPLLTPTVRSRTRSSTTPPSFRARCTGTASSAATATTSTR